ncbi:MAG: hypothetical protein ACHQHO_05010 [Solirubrobacterales bacterium]
MRRAVREFWEILGIWWVLIPGGIVAAIATVQLVEGIRHKPLWFWTTWVMTGFAVAGFIRSIRVGKERDAARAALVDQDASLKDWLGRQIDELRGLLTTLERVLDDEPFDYERARPIHQYFWQIHEGVDRRLHTTAPEWVDYFNEGEISTGAGLFYPQADLLRSQFIPAIESTIDRIAHIQARL